MGRSKRHAPLVGLSLMTEPIFLQTTQPLFAAGEVEVLEWSFDMAWGLELLPPWVQELIEFYSERVGGASPEESRLLGHGVSYSLLSGQWSERQAEWLDCLQEECQLYQYRHVSEHFGWMSAGNFVQSAPLPLPLTADTLRLGRDRLQRIADVIEVPIGLENLAFAFGLSDVLQQGEFLDQLLEPVQGFLVLDLHNLFCQIHNFQRSPIDLISRYPLHRVREIHVSGGSWSSAQNGNSIRRDTHDQAIPEEVFELLAIALPQCPNIEAVIFERIGHTLTDEREQEQFRKDFYRIKELVR
jgi:uncharacterized protein